MSNVKYDYMVKFILLGESGVGKTNLIDRFCSDNYQPSF